MKLVFFVRPGCSACENAKEKIRFFLEKWGIAGSVQTETIDLSTTDGLVEAAMRDVSDVPTILLEDGGGEVTRWTHRAPASDDLRNRLGC